MANDGIRLPSDSTVATQAIRRGSEQSGPVPVLPETKPAPPPPSPLETIVLQSKAMVEGKQAGLYLLLLQNDPKSNPPLQLLADTAIKPGTPLLIERDEQGQYRPVERISAEQLQRLVKLELDFWQAHLVPKAQKSESIPLPSANQLQWLATQKPELKPLLQWLMPRATVELSAQTLQQWVKAFTPMANRLTWPAIATAPAGQTNNTAPQVSNAAAQPNSSPNLAPAATSTSVTNEKPLAATTLNLLTRAVAINIPVHQSSIPAQSNMQTPLLNGLAVATTLASAPTTTSATAALTAPTTTTSATTVPATATATATTTPATTSLNLTGVRLIATPMVQLNGTSPVGVIGKPVATNAALPISTSVASVANAQAKTVTSTQTPASGNADAKLTAPAAEAVIVSQGTQSKAVLGSPAPRENTFLPPGVEGRIPDTRAAIIESRLADWLTRSEQAIKQDAPSLQIQLQQRAQQLLYSSELLQSKIKHGLLQNANPKAAASEAESPLLAVRHWLDSTLAKVQSLAVQNALQQWSAPDQPAVQQAQIPLIWLGLGGWVDIEWWAQKQAKDANKEADKHKRRWSLRLFLSIEPLADICADIDWGRDYTQVVFWSNDRSTLAHLNQLLPTLKAWSVGLSDDCAIETKRGFPKRMREQAAPDSQHLVDILT